MSYALPFAPLPEAYTTAHTVPRPGATWTAPSIATFIVDSPGSDSAHQRVHTHVHIARMWAAWQRTPQGPGIARLPLAPPDLP